VIFNPCRLDLVHFAKSKNVVSNRIAEIAVYDETERERYRYNIPYGALLHVKDKDKCKKGQSLFEWDPYNNVIIANKSGKIEFINNAYVKRGEKKDLEVKLFKPKLKVGLLKSHTHMYAEEFLAFKDFDGLVIEGTALGQLPNAKVDEFTAESDKIGSAIRTLTSKMPVVMASQCLYGLVDMNVYSEGRRNIELGILGNYSNMSPETTFVKLAWLLSNFDKEAIPELITTNFRGEMIDRIEDDMFLN